MRLFSLVFLVLASISTLSADSSPPRPVSIRLPVFPAPMPPPAPLAVTSLASDQLYVIDSDVPCIVLASPAGIVTLGEDSGPIKIRGKFVDGNGSVESRTYAGKSVYTVEAIASGRVELLIVPAGGTKEEVIRRTLDVGQATPPGPPSPKPEPRPVALWGFVVVEETADAVAARGAMLSDSALAALVRSKGYRWRIVDQDVVGADGKPPADVSPCLNAAKGKVLPQAFAIDSRGNIVAQEALTNAATLIEMLKKAGQ